MDQDWPKVASVKTPRQSQRRGATRSCASSLWPVVAEVAKILPGLSLEVVCLEIAQIVVCFLIGTDNVGRFSHFATRINQSTSLANQTRDAARMKCECRMMIVIGPPSFSSSSSSASFSSLCDCD